MASSYIAYKRSDELRVARLVAALESHGLDVWWDRKLPNAESFREHLEKRLDEAGCVVVVWSKHSTQGDNRFVLDEARRGYERKILVAAMIDDVSIPLGFGEIQAVDLRHWKKDPADPFLIDLVEAIRAKLDGREAPPTIGPAMRLRRIVRRSAAGTVGAATLMGLAFNSFGISGRVCTVEGLQPGLSDGCGALGLGGRPSKAERLTWTSLPAGSCTALQGYINRFPDSPLSEQAGRLLLAKQVRTVEEWQPVTRPLALFVPPGAPAASLEAAQAAAIARARPDAERLCAGFGSGTLYRYKGAQPVAQQWHCSGSTCGFDGVAQCQLELRVERQAETCFHSKTPASSP